MPTTTNRDSGEIKKREQRALGGSVFKVKGRDGLFGQCYVTAEMTDENGKPLKDEKGKALSVTKRKQQLLVTGEELAALRAQKKNVDRIAAARLAEFVIAAKNATPKVQTKDGPTIGKLISDHLAKLNPTKRHTRIVTAQLERFRDARGIGANTLVKKITDETVQSYVAALSREKGAAYVVVTKDEKGEEVRTTNHRPMSPATIRRHCAALSKLFRLAVKRKVIDSNPVRGLDLPQKQEFTPESVPNAVEVANIVRHARPQIRDALTFLAETGCRYSEAMNLQWSRVDLASGRVTIAPEVTAATTTKSGKSRDVTLTANAREVLDRLKASHTRPMEGPDFVFARISHPRFFKLFKRAVRAAGLPSSTRIHDLRHSLASRMVMNGVPISVVAVAIGDSLPVAMRYARHAPTDAVANAFRLMESVAVPAAKKSKAKKVAS